MKQLFTTEMMTCEHCHWTYKADPKVESQWTVVEVDGKLLYYCPSCWGIPFSRWPKEEVEAWKRDHPKP